MKLEINKNRSFTACLRDARDFLIDNIETFAQKVWIPALIFSVLIALCVFFRLPNLSLHNWGVSHPWTSWIVQTIIYAGTFISEILYFSSVFNTVNGYGRTRNFGRYLQYFLVNILIDAVFFLVCWGLKNLFTALIGSHPLSHIAHLTILSLYVLICVVLFLLITIPMLYVAPKYMMEKDAKWKQLFRHFSTGFHRWGMLFMTTLLLSIIIGLIMFILAMPAMVLISAQISSQMGLFIGDPANLPGYFPILSFLVFTITALLFSATMIYTIVTFIYVYGSINTRKKTKEEMTIKYNEKN